MTNMPVASVNPMLDGATSPADLKRPLYGASMGQAVKRFFRNYATFSGRASRSEFWFTQLFLFLINLIPGFLYGLGLGATLASLSTSVSADGSTEIVTTNATTAAGSVMLFIGGALMFVIGVAVLIPSLALWWRRLHDGNFPGPMYFLSFIPGVGSIILWVFALLPSKPEGRRFDVSRAPEGAAI